MNFKHKFSYLEFTMNICRCSIILIVWMTYGFKWLNSWHTWGLYQHWNHLWMWGVIGCSNSRQIFSFERIERGWATQNILLNFQYIIFLYLLNVKNCSSEWSGNMVVTSVLRNDIDFLSHNFVVMLKVTSIFESCKNWLLILYCLNLL